MDCVSDKMARNTGIQVRAERRVRRLDVPLARALDRAAAARRA